MIEVNFKITDKFSFNDYSTVKDLLNYINNVIKHVPLNYYNFTINSASINNFYEETLVSDIINNLKSNVLVIKKIKEFNNNDVIKHLKNSFISYCNKIKPEETNNNCCYLCGNDIDVFNSIDLKNKELNNKILEEVKENNKLNTEINSLKLIIQKTKRDNSIEFVQQEVIDMLKKDINVYKDKLLSISLLNERNKLLNNKLINLINSMNNQEIIILMNEIISNLNIDNQCLSKKRDSTLLSNIQENKVITKTCEVLNNKENNNNINLKLGCNLLNNNQYTKTINLNCLVMQNIYNFDILDNNVNYIYNKYSSSNISKNNISLTSITNENNKDKIMLKNKSCICCIRNKHSKERCLAFVIKNNSTFSIINSKRKFNKLYIKRCNNFDFSIYSKNIECLIPNNFNTNKEHSKNNKNTFNNISFNSNNLTKYNKKSKSAINLKHSKYINKNSKSISLTEDFNKLCSYNNYNVKTYNSDKINYNSLLLKKHFDFNPVIYNNNNNNISLKHLLYDNKTKINRKLSIKNTLDFNKNYNKSTSSIKFINKYNSCKENCLIKCKEKDSIFHNYIEKHLVTNLSINNISKDEDYYNNNSYANEIIDNKFNNVITLNDSSISSSELIINNDSNNNDNNNNTNKRCIYNSINNLDNIIKKKVNKYFKSNIYKISLFKILDYSSVLEYNVNDSTIKINNIIDYNHFDFKDNYIDDNSNTFLNCYTGLFIITGTSNDKNNKSYLLKNKFYYYDNINKRINKLNSLEHNSSKGCLIYLNILNKILCISGEMSNKVSIYCFNDYLEYKFNNLEYKKSLLYKQILKLNSKLNILNKWLDFPSLNFKRSKPGIIVINQNIIYVAFGYTDCSSKYNTIERFNINNNFIYDYYDKFKYTNKSYNSYTWEIIDVTLEDKFDINNFYMFSINQDKLLIFNDKFNLNQLNYCNFDLQSKKNINKNENKNNKYYIASNNSFVHLNDIIVIFKEKNKIAYIDINIKISNILDFNDII